MQIKPKDIPDISSSGLGALAQDDPDIQRSLEMLREVKEALFTSFQKHADANGWHHDDEQASGEAMSLQAVIETEARIKAMLSKSKTNPPVKLGEPQ